MSMGALPSAGRWSWASRRGQACIQAPLEKNKSRFKKIKPIIFKLNTRKISNHTSLPLVVSLPFLIFFKRTFTLTLPPPPRWLWSLLLMSQCGQGKKMCFLFMYASWEARRVVCQERKMRRDFFSFAWLRQQRNFWALQFIKKVLFVAVYLLSLLKECNRHTNMFHFHAVSAPALLHRDERGKTETRGGHWWSACPRLYPSHGDPCLSLPTPWPCRKPRNRTPSALCRREGPPTRTWCRQILCLPSTLLPMGVRLLFASRGALRNNSPSAPTLPFSGKPLPFFDFRRGMGMDLGPKLAESWWGGTGIWTPNLLPESQEF